MTDEVSVKVPVEFREPIVNMGDALRKFLEAGRKLSEVWDKEEGSRGGGGAGTEQRDQWEWCTF